MVRFLGTKNKEETLSSADQKIPLMHDALHFLTFCGSRQYT